MQDINKHASSLIFTAQNCLSGWRGSASAAILELQWRSERASHNMNMRRFFCHHHLLHLHLHLLAGNSALTLQ